MPRRAKRPCAHPHCPKIQEGKYCDEHKKEDKPFARFDEKKRPNSRKRGYTSKWEKARLGYLNKHPLCTDPFGFHGGRPTAANIVDHIVPHRGDWKVFWDSDNWQSLCRRCHTVKTAKGE